MRVNESLWRAQTMVTAAPLKGDRSVFQREQLRPRCPFCMGRLRPGELLCGWEPALRVPWVFHKLCGNDWLERDPRPVVDALTSYWDARQPGEGVEPYLAFTVERLRRLWVEVPPVLAETGERATPEAAWLGKPG